MIGTLHPERLTCAAEHLPGCYNPHSDDTYCICGGKVWPGRVGTWHSMPRHEPAPAMPSLGVGVGAVGFKEQPRTLLGWDTYFIHAMTCPNREGADDPSHICGEVAT